MSLNQLIKYMLHCNIAKWRTFGRIVHFIVVEYNDPARLSPLRPAFSGFPDPFAWFGPIKGAGIRLAKLGARGPKARAATR